ncbi:bifunctional diaminohydroxyphosphoribosylaminopyrimidine deaminase/5-amino-6-(5-phosphoribosylamino)uracil reductase RibD [Bacillus badius]|uniref:Riboflavin biosynthesis protein RibD n=1 Tax=Bacillus badius TaxID=1455 RepID=A0ABR5AWJ3_BACBA|nr:bifunctional diaminohydroxyphosphoribosylaminopyrimidine deaminase/5-amino-6-(5-phosphoribosylamino)uracil reductase RibD [Bacillus badius]KIL74629.1 Diaminohydroxyphosphoribosylaminopyrimidine deaminase [Bacillus badius]KIL79094.1 Diaminohydroxyphosphoribosylaminopyrimidine deaminase [Bacillus badius]MED4715480.1 bifunctional diaminohydroxyphosphoribosylaminopyrimidine deaminase/5-amino-6-(5-phosphoribosylamino)uracil reductase RibD [Bacillus badius]
MLKEQYMELALSLAEGVKGQTSPNPPVGAVVVKDGRVIGMGAHLKAGEAHAEVHALRAAGKEAAGADLYVTLEPCSHYGKTPPCANLVASSGIKRVFIATVDPNPRVSGKGVQKLESAGIEVEIGVCRERADRLLEPFFHFIQHQTPFVTMKTAITADGKTAAYTGHSRWITDQPAREDVHCLRHEHDAILVGVNTVLQDNPLLTTRLPHGGKHPIRVILDTHLRIPITANVIENKEADTIIVCGSEASLDKEEALIAAGADVIRLETADIHIPLLLEKLGEEEIMTLLVEGGGEVNASFFQEKAFQRIVIYMAPKLIGGKMAPTPFAGEGFPTMDESIQLVFDKVEMIGQDIKITASRKEG